MNNILQILRKPNKKALITVIAAGLLSLVAVAGIVLADGPQFNIFPISYTGDLNHDLSLLDARNVTKGESWSGSQSDHNAGVIADPGDIIEFSIYYHNGAVNKPENIANNTRIRAFMPSGSSNEFTLGASIFADNAATVSSSSAGRGGDMQVHISGSVPQTLDLIPGTTILRANRGLDNPPSPQTLPDSIFSPGVGIGDVQACWDFQGLVNFKVKVSESQPVSALDMEKLVRNVSDNTGFFNQVNADPGEIVEFKLVGSNTGQANLTEVVVTDSLPSRLSFVSGTLQSSKPIISGDLFSGGLFLADLAPGENVTITFKAEVANKDHFAFGTTELVNTASMEEQGSTPAGPISDTAKVVIKKDAPNVLACTLSPQEGRILIDFGFNSDDPSMLANQSLSRARKGPFGITLAAGKYKVTLVAFDDHIGKPGQFQPQESYFLKLRNSSGNLVINTGHTKDIPDNKNYVTDVVNTDLFVSETIASVIAFHAAFPSGNPNSLLPVCAAFDKIAQPDVSVDKTVRNINTGIGFAETVQASPSDVVEFQIVIRNTGNVNLDDVIGRDILPTRLSFKLGTMLIDGLPASCETCFFGIGINLGTLMPTQERKIIFRADVAGQNQFSVGTTNLVNTAFVKVFPLVEKKDLASVLVEKIEIVKEDGDGGARPL